MGDVNDLAPASPPSSSTSPIVPYLTHIDTNTQHSVQFFSPRLQEILDDEQEFQMFLNFLAEWKCDVDLLFVMQIDQLKELASDSHDLFIDQVNRIFVKHIVEHAELPLTQLHERALRRLRESIETKEVRLDDFLMVQQKIKAELDKNFVPKFLKSKSDNPLVGTNIVIGSDNYIPSLKQVMHDLECLQLFVLYLMKDSRHRMFLFWLELQNLKTISGDGSEMKNQMEEFRKMDKIYRKYVSSGMMSNGAPTDIVTRDAKISIKDSRKTMAPSSTTSVDAGSPDISIPDPDVDRIKVLTTTLTEMHKKVGRLLRLELWPQFCQSQLFSDFLQQRKNSRKLGISDSNNITPGKGGLNQSFTSSGKRMSLLSLYKNHISSDDVVVTVPKPDEFFKLREQFANNSEPKLRVLDYVAVVKGSIVASKNTGKRNESMFISESVKQYPSTAWSDVGFPQHLPLFCFPEKTGKYNTDGIVKSKNTPSPPRLFNFVFNQDGTLYYGACLQLSDVNLGDHEDKKLHREPHQMYGVCVITRAPLVDRLRSLLKTLCNVPRKANIFESAEYKSLIQLTSETYSFPPKATALHLPKFRLNFGPEFLTSVDFDFSALFTIMHPYKILSILEYLLLEKKVLLVSSQLSLLTIVGETLRLLMYPFKFQFLYTPVLPRALLSALQCPTPFLIGIHSSLKEEALQMEHIHQDLYVVDLDFDSVTPAYVVECPFPPLVRTKILRYFRSACFGELIDLDYSHVERKNFLDTHDDDPVVSLRKRLVHAWMEDLIQDLQNFLVVIPDTRDGKPPLLLLDAPAFFRGKNESYIPFLKAFFKSGAFSAFVGELVAQKGVDELCILGDWD